MMTASQYDVDRKRLTSIDEQVLPQTLAKTHALNAHAFQDCLHGIFEIADGTGLSCGAVTR